MFASLVANVCRFACSLHIWLDQMTETQTTGRDAFSKAETVWLVTMDNGTSYHVRAATGDQAAHLAIRETACRWLDNDSNPEANQYFIGCLGDEDVLTAAVVDGRGGRPRSLRRLTKVEVALLSEWHVNSTVRKVTTRDVSSTGRIYARAQSVFAEWCRE